MPAAIEIHPVRALRDNYAYLVVVDGKAAVVDPGEAAPVIDAALRLGVEPIAIWNTHHHWDHVGGNLELIERFGVRDVVASEYDGAQARVPGQTRRVPPDGAFDLAGARVETIAIPAHTLGHLCYRIGEHAFPGDTLFGAGCGRLFEGTPAQMVAALSRLRALPDETRVWCGHEYTMHNLQFAIGIEKDNPELRARFDRVAAMPDDRDRPRCTIPLSLAEERATNPMLRWDAPAIRRFAGTDDAVDAFAAVRRAKDVWKPT